MKARNRMWSLGGELLVIFAGWILLSHFSASLASGLGMVVGICLIAYWHENPKAHAANQNFTFEYRQRLALVKDSESPLTTACNFRKSAGRYRGEREVLSGFEVNLAPKQGELSDLSERI